MLEPLMLTKREAEVITLLFRGMRRKEMAQLLGISISTLDDHLNHVYDKAGVTGAIDLLAMTRRNGGFLY